MPSHSVPPTMPTMPLTVVGHTTTTTQPKPSPSPSPSHSLSQTLTVTVTVLTVAVTVLFALYFLLRYFRRHHSPPTAAPAAVFSSGSRISPEIAAPSSIDSLPLFAFSSVTRRSAAYGGGGDCAVCLSRFEQRDLLRLLPLCCHAFHAECIDTWLRSNLTCPLCRSAVFASKSDVGKILRSSFSAAGDSFRLEIGSISRRGISSSAAGETRARSYSVGEFDYLVDDVNAEIPLSQACRRIDSSEKEDSAALEPPAAILAGEVASGRTLKDYYDLVSASISSTMSFRSSGRFFSGSSRRNDIVPVGDYDVEANRFGEEISEMFRWFSMA